MTSERWQEIDRLLDAALERPRAERSAFLAEACQGDEPLRLKLEALLRADEEAASFIETPAAAFAAELLLATTRAGRSSCSRRADATRRESMVFSGQRICAASHICNNAPVAKPRKNLRGCSLIKASSFATTFRRHWRWRNWDWHAHWRWLANPKKRAGCTKNFSSSGKMPIPN